jgi:4-hydroxy-2-oxoheptanedioate aldolase
MATDIIKNIRAGRTSIGVWGSSGSPLVTEVVARTHPDWILLDTQHGAVTESSLLPLMTAIAAGGSTPLVRVRPDDPSLIMRALDLGAAGVVVPMVSTPEQARSAVAATRYPPLGNRSFGPLHGYQATPGEPFDPLCLVMIETAEGVERIDEIVSIDGLDGVFVGPADLALGLGVGPVAYDSLGAVHDAVKTIFGAARSRDLVAGAAGFSPAMTTELLDLGGRFISAGSDLGYVTAGAAADARRRAELIAKYPN